MNKAQEKELTLDWINDSAKHYEENKSKIYEPLSTNADKDGFVQQSVHMQFEKTIYRVLDFFINEENNALEIIVVRADVPFENIQFHETYTSKILQLNEDKLRIIELLLKVESL